MDQPDIFSASVQAQALNVLDDIFKYGLEEKDDGALMCGFLLLKYLSEKNNYFLLNPYGKVRYTSVGWLCQAYRSLSTSKDHTDKPIRLIILEILTHIHLEIDSCETICRELIPYKFKNDQFSLSELLYLSRLGQRIIQTFLDYAENIPLHLLDSYVKRLTDSFEMICTLHKGPIDDLVF